MTDYTAIEFYGTGDPFFGGDAEDRPLGVCGTWLVAPYHRGQVARFPTRQAALDAAALAPNGRGGSISASPAAPLTEAVRPAPAK